MKRIVLGVERQGSWIIDGYPVLATRTGASPARVELSEDVLDDWVGHPARTIRRPAEREAPMATRVQDVIPTVGWFRQLAPLWPLGIARILYGVLWWQQSGWKVPSDDFGRRSGGGLWYWVHQEIQYPTLAAYKSFLVNVMIPHWTFFGWMTLVTETTIGVLLILGLFTRLGSLMAIGMAVNITVGILNVPHEWGWTYTMLITLPVLFLFTAAGRSFGVDAFLVAPLERAHGRGNRIAGVVRWLI